MDASRGPSAAPDVAGGPVGLPATELAAAVRAGTLTAVDVVRAHLDHLADVEPRIGAFRVVRREAALAEAAAVDASPQRDQLPLAGVPVAIKDNVAVAGETTTDGCTTGNAAPATADDEVVARLRAAGAIVVGITRVPELCVFGATDSAGSVTRNPWDTARTAGGSSGGSAAAVAAGVVPIAHGSDGMGSLRVPAAACGLVTLKPGAGVLPGGLGADDWSGMAVHGALTTTVADQLLAFGVLAGDPRPAIEAPPGALRIAVGLRSPVPGTRPDREARTAVEVTARLLREAGHTVVSRDFVVPPAAALAGLARWFAGAADDARALGLDRDALEPRSRVHVRLGAAVRRLHLLRPRSAVAFRERAERFFTDVDVLLTPVVTGPPLSARPWHERGWTANVVANARWAPYPSPWNLAGVPAVVVPAGRRGSGQPLAVQLVGPPGSEGRLLSLAGELEHRRPWRRHAPTFDPALQPSLTGV